MDETSEPTDFADWVVRLDDPAPPTGPHAPPEEPAPAPEVPLRHLFRGTDPLPEGYAPRLRRFDEIG